MDTEPATNGTTEKERESVDGDGDGDEDGDGFKRGSKGVAHRLRQPNIDITATIPAT
jgi:hypothetical protein